MDGNHRLSCQKGIDRYVAAELLIVHAGGFQQQGNEGQQVEDDHGQKLRKQDDK